MLNRMSLGISGANRSWLRWTLTSLTAALLSACGFHLRDSATLPFKSIYMTFATNSPLGVELKRNILASGSTVILPLEQGAEATLQVLDDAREKVARILNNQGRASEHCLYYKLTFRVLDVHKKELLAPTLITLKRDISYNSSQALSKAEEEVLLYRHMQTDMVQQILRRMATIKTAPPTQVAPSAQAPADKPTDKPETPASTALTVQ